MQASFDPPAPIPDNRIPDLGEDKDIVTSKKNLKDSEKSLGHNWTLLQLDAESDPICSSAGCTQYLHPQAETHPMDYFVPNFGRDHDNTIATEQSLAASEKMLGHKWDWKPVEEEIVDYPHPPLDSEI